MPGCYHPGGPVWGPIPGLRFHGTFGGSNRCNHGNPHDELLRLEEHGGSIRMERSTGEWSTVVRIRLPKAEGAR